MRLAPHGTAFARVFCFAAKNGQFTPLIVQIEWGSSTVPVSSLAYRLVLLTLDRMRDWSNRVPACFESCWDGVGEGFGLFCIFSAALRAASELSLQPQILILDPVDFRLVQLASWQGDRVLWKPLRWRQSSSVSLQYLARACQFHANGAARLGLPLPCAIPVWSVRIGATLATGAMETISDMLRYMQRPGSYIRGAYPRISGQHEPANFLLKQINLPPLLLTRSNNGIRNW